MIVATFNLIATIVGGSVLSLPLAFARCGLILGTVLMIFAAVITDRSLFLLCLCARRTGATSYGEVGKAAFGQNMEYFISGLLFVFLVFVLMAYMVLLEDIWTDIVEIVGNRENVPAQLVLLVIILLMSPFLAQRTLHALRFNCYVGFASVSILCLALCHHAFITPLPDPLLLWTTSWNDVLFAFPIITLSFLSIFNILPIQGALLHPSRDRMQGVIGGAVSGSLVLSLVFAISGYLYAGSATNGNILLNCDHHSDWMFFLGRLGCGVTIMLAMAMMLLPCRDSLLEVLDVLTNHPHIVRVEEEQLLLLSSARNSDTLPDPLLVMAKRPKLRENRWVHYTSTIGIVAICYLSAVRVPGVALVWSLCGSWMAFIIAFILPAACFLKIQTKYPPSNDDDDRSSSQAWIVFSWILLLLSLVSAVACSLQTIMAQLI